MYNHQIHSPPELFHFLKLKLDAKNEFLALDSPSWKTPFILLSVSEKLELKDWCKSSETNSVDY